MPTPKAPVLVALGSNLGDVVAHLSEAVELLSERIEIEAVSGIWRTAPMYVEDQPEFANAALLGRTDLGPRPLRSFLKHVESQIGRRERVRNGPREIDLDLIAYGCLAYAWGEADYLHVPHPRAVERAFVLGPLQQVAPDWSLFGKTVAEWWTATEIQAQRVMLREDAVLPLPRHGP